MEAISDWLSEATLFLVLLVVLLSHKLRWRESTFLLLLVPALLPEIVAKILVLRGTEPVFPLFLMLYSGAAFGLLVWGGIERYMEHAALAPFRNPSDTATSGIQYVPDDDRFSHG